MRNSLITLYHADTAIKIDFWVTDAVDFTEKYARSQNINIEDQLISVISAEDLILTKLSWCKEVMSERHLRDCIGIWKIQKKNLDEAYMQKKAAQLGITGLLAQVISNKKY